MTPSQCHPERQNEGHGMCRPCYRSWYWKTHKTQARAAVLRWQKENPEKFRATWKRRDYATSYCKYGLTVGEYRQLQARFGRTCPICKREEIRRRLCLDHDHRTGKIRGMLCDACNISLGKFEDNPEWLRRAALYVEGRLFKV